MDQAATPAATVSSPPKPMAPRQVSIAALLISVLLLTVGTNLQGVLLPIRRQLEGSSMQAIGLLSSGWSFGFVVACIFVGRLVSAVGHVRSYAGLTALSAAAGLLFVPLNNETVWVVLRIVIGFCFGGLSMITESWLNERASQGNRGAVFAAYMTVSLAASLVGTISLTFLDTADPQAYTLMVLVIILSIVPVALTRSPTPQPIQPFTISLGALYRVSPTGTMGCFAIGLSSGAIGGLLSVYGLGIGLSPPRVAHLLAAALVGGALAYYPVGVLSDRVDRRLVIVVLSFLSAGLSAVLAVATHLPPWMVLVLIGSLGFTQYPIYGLCIALTNDRVREQSFSEIASELLIVYGIGTVLGPPIAAWLMHRNPGGLFVFLAVILAAQGSFTASRLYCRAAARRDAVRRSHPLEMAPHSVRVIRPRDDT